MCSPHSSPAPESTTSSWAHQNLTAPIRAAEADALLRRTAAAAAAFGIDAYESGLIMQAWFTVNEWIPAGGHTRRRPGGRIDSRRTPGPDLGRRRHRRPDNRSASATAADGSARLVRVGRKPGRAVVVAGDAVVEDAVVDKFERPVGRIGQRGLSS